MGNAGSSSITRERQKSSLSDVPISPNSRDDPESEPEKKFSNRLVFHGSSQEEEEPYYTKPIVEDKSVANELKPEEAKPTPNYDAEKTPALPTVFKWEGGGKQVYISGTFSDWKILPMVRSHGDFVTIIDLPEGEHEYKFFVDGEWKHDPKIVSYVTNVFNVIQPNYCIQTS